jgi:hypothetical protein
MTRRYTLALSIFTWASASFVAQDLRVTGAEISLILRRLREIGRAD